VHAVSGTAGGAAAMTLFYPLDVIRTHHQTRPDSSVLSLIETMGPGMLYQGLKAVLISLGISNFVYFYTNNLLKVLLRRISQQKDVTIVQNLFIASLAGVVNVLLTCPLWVANTRLKLQSGMGHGQSKPSSTSGQPRTTEEKPTKQSPHANDEPYKGMMDCLTRIAKEEGISSLWNGTASSLMLVSNPTIHFVVYDKVKGLISERALTAGRKTLTPFEIFLTGAIAKALATVLTYPVQLAQTRQRANRETSPGLTSTYNLLSEVYGKAGFYGWFAGMTTKLLQTILTAAFQFLCYEQIQMWIFRLMGRPTR